MTIYCTLLPWRKEPFVSADHKSWLTQNLSDRRQSRLLSQLLGCHDNKNILLFSGTSGKLVKPSFCFLTLYIRSNLFSESGGNMHQLNDVTVVILVPLKPSSFLLCICMNVPHSRLHVEWEIRDGTTTQYNLNEKNHVHIKQQHRYDTENTISYDFTIIYDKCLLRYHPHPKNNRLF